MRSVLVLVVLSIVTFQNAAPKEVSLHPHQVAYLFRAEKSLRNIREARQLKDVWNTVKNSAKNLWNSVKTIVSNTKEKIKTWIQNYKTKAKDIIKSFEERVKQIREKSRKIIEEIVGTGHIVKGCIEKNSTHIERILKQIIKNVSTCVSEKVAQVAHLEDHIRENKGSEVNETRLIADIEERLNVCLERPETAEDCMHAVRKEVIGDMENMESNVLKQGTESRGIVDDLLGSIITCSVEGLLEASNAIAEETVHIIRCVIKGESGADS